jgi:Cof subfamily protein (haloacid dehalogenase superfamily)
MMYPLVCAVDVDGTLVGPDKTISEVNAQGVEKYVSSGGKIVLASGRMHSSILRYAKELNLQDSDLILSYNGAMVRSVGSDLLFENPVPAAEAEEIVEFCNDNHLHLNYYVNDTLFVRELNECSQLYLERSGSMSTPVGSLSTMKGCRPSKLLIIDQKKRLDELTPSVRARYGRTLYITKTDDEYLEFMAKGVNKGAALERVAALLGIERDKVAAFGDSFNDVEMLRWAGLGVAMSNGRVEAQQAADIVADNSAWSAVGMVLGNFNVAD